ncbi:kelch-like protein 17 [Littorina saxatilis]|uniref:kelch-like protein 17 n=1 Tax=Littorina saxatilis TaxID=31220 RepID=UPI0038B68A13
MAAPERKHSGAWSLAINCSNSHAKGFRMFKFPEEETNIELDPTKVYLICLSVEALQKGHGEVDEATAADSTTPPKAEDPCDAQNVLALPDETSDVILEVEGRELHASRAVLAHYSPVFRKMFYSDFREKSQAKVPLHGKEFKSVVKFFNVMFPRTAASKTLVADANLIELLTLADEYQADQVKVVCQYYIGEQLSLYFHNFYNRHARDAANNPAPLNTPRLVKGNMEGQNVSKTELIQKLVLYMWACDQYELPEHREVVKSLLVSLISKLKEVTESRHYPSLPPLSKVDLLETLCSKFEKGSSELQDSSSEGQPLLQSSTPFGFGSDPTTVAYKNPRGLRK